VRIGFQLFNYFDFDLTNIYLDAVYSDYLKTVRNVRPKTKIRGIYSVRSREKLSQKLEKTMKYSHEITAAHFYHKLKSEDMANFVKFCRRYFGL